MNFSNYVKSSCPIFALFTILTSFFYVDKALINITNPLIAFLNTH